MNQHCPNMDYLEFINFQLPGGNTNRKKEKVNGEVLSDVLGCCGKIACYTISKR